MGCMWERYGVDCPKLPSFTPLFVVLTRSIAVALFLLVLGVNLSQSAGVSVLIYGASHIHGDSTRANYADADAWMVGHEIERPKAEASGKPRNS